MIVSCLQTQTRMMSDFSSYLQYYTFNEDTITLFDLTERTQAYTNESNKTASKYSRMYLIKGKEVAR